MRYTAPRITRTVVATSAIRSKKAGTVQEVNQIAFTSNPAYQSDE